MVVTSAAPTQTSSPSHFARQYSDLRPLRGRHPSRDVASIAPSLPVARCRTKKMPSAVPNSDSIDLISSNEAASQIMDAALIERAETIDALGRVSLPLR